MSLIFVNAGMYERDKYPKGLLIIKGKELHELDTLKGIWQLLPTMGFVLIVYPSIGPYYPRVRQIADSAGMPILQSGPMMLVGGEINPLFNDGSPNRHIRNAVGVTASNEVIFAMSEQPVTFYEMASYLLKHGCRDALYLDGAISQMYAPALGLPNLEVGNHLGPIFAIWGEPYSIP